MKLYEGSPCPTNMCPGILVEDGDVENVLWCRDCRKFFNIGAEID